MIQLPRMNRGGRPYRLAVERTRALVRERAAHYAAVYGVTHGRISIRKQRTRWGSCSERGDLSFNYRLGFLPEHLMEYVVVHEICHIREQNHSAAFWDLVALACPDPKALRKELAQYRF